MISAGSDLPLVSVALVTYNQVEFLPTAVEAVLAQDYPALQLVIADDCSEDGTSAYLDRLAATGDNRFTIVRAMRNQGVTANQQAALDACRGKYISWMAGDDVMLPGKIARQVAVMEADPSCAVCYHDLELFDSETGRVICKFSDMDRPREGKMAILVRHGAFNGATSNMVRTECSPDFADSVATASDWLYYVGCLERGRKIRYIPEVLGRYRRHSGNVTGEMGRSQPAHLHSEHLQSCAIILARWPDMAEHARYRMAALLRGQRWEGGGQHYREWLRASLELRWTPTTFAALWIDRLLGIRR